MPIDLRNPQDANWLAEGRGEDPDEDNPGEADYSNNGVIQPNKEDDAETDE